jgi:hypothetical protein
MEKDIAEDERGTRPIRSGPSRSEYGFLQVTRHRP